MVLTDMASVHNNHLALQEAGAVPYIVRALDGLGARLVAVDAVREMVYSRMRTHQRMCTAVMNAGLIQELVGMMVHLAMSTCSSRA